MRTRRLGKTDLDLTVLGFGTYPLGGRGWKFTWGAQDDEQSIAAIRAALESGINWIDTAAVYGGGHSEEIVGRALESGLRDEVIIASKCCRYLDDKGTPYSDMLNADIAQECEDSLRRLKTDRIDLYQIHWADSIEGIEHVWPQLQKLIDAGKIRYAGVSNFDIEMLESAQAIAPIASLQPPYSMIRREIETDLLPYCEEHGIGVVAYSPLQTGLLTGAFTRARRENMDPEDWRGKYSPYFQEPSFSATLDLANGLTAIAARREISCAQLAIAWVLLNEVVTSAIVGARNPTQIVETAPAGDIELSAEEVQEIEDLIQAREERVAAS